MKILVVEDSKEYSDLLCALLRGESYEVRAALDGASGVKAALEFLPDLMLLDYQLGDMSGYDVASALRYMRATSSIPFILLSSLGGDPLLLSSFKKLRNFRASVVKTQPLHDILRSVKTVGGSLQT